MSHLEAAWQRLAAAAKQGKVGTLLDGVHLALVGHRSDAAATHRLMQAARELGARVSVLAERDLLAPQQPRAGDAARLLGRLYEGLDCDCGDPAVLDWLATESGLPVTAWVTRGGAGALLLQRFAESAAGAAAAPQECERLSLQAALLASFGSRPA